MGVHPESGDVVVMVGTTKGAFLLHSNGSRRQWHVDGPHFAGEEVYALMMDQRGGRQTLWASPGNPFFGIALVRSDDFGATWSPREERAVKFPEGSGVSLKRIWQIQPGRTEEPDHLLLGVEPTCVFESTDGGDTFRPVQGLLEHEHRPHWTPGAGGMCLHTILTDPETTQRTLIACSTGGVYRTDDGGTTWKARNVGVRAEFLPDKHPEFGQCVHKVVHHRAKPGRLFLQNHWGLYRSDDWGDTWTDIANGVPSDFGFAMAMHPVDTDTVYIVPLESDMFRCCPEGKMRVYRTRNAGDSWEPMHDGLPQDGVYETVLRDSMHTDALSPAGVYFGTRSGKVWGSADDGETWSLLRDGLPSVTCVKAAVVA
jgi:hypothetical protein